MNSKKIIILFSLSLIFFYGEAQVKTWTFKECVDRAVEQNITINQEKLNNEVDKVNWTQSKYSRTPSLNFSGNQGFNSGRSVDPFTNQFVTQNIRTNNFSLSGSVTLFNGNQNLNTIKQNKLNYQAGLLDVAQVKNNVILNLSSAYLGVLLAYEQASIAQNQVKLTEARVESTKELVKGGKVAELDLYKISAQLESDRVAVINAENQIILSKLSLAQIMNIPASEDFEIEKMNMDVVPMYVEMSTDDIYNTALGIQPIVKSAEIFKSSNVVGLKISQGALLPRLVLSGNLFTGYSSARTLNSSSVSYQTTPIGYLQSDPSQVVLGSIPSSTITRGDYPFTRQLNDNIGRSIQLTLNIPILNNRQFKSNIERSRINIKYAELNEANVKNNLRKDIEKAHTDMKSAYKRYEAGQKQVEAFEKSYTGTEIRYNLGMTTPTDLMLEKNNFINGQLDFLQAKYQYLFNVKVIDLYVGKEITF